MRQVRRMTAAEGRRQDEINRGYWKLVKAFTPYKEHLGGQAEAPKFKPQQKQPSVTHDTKGKTNSKGFLNRVKNFFRKRV